MPSNQLNQFNQTALKGSLSHVVATQVIAVQVDPASVNTLVAGSAVKITDVAGNQITVDLCAAADAPFGYVVRNPKTNSFVAKDTVEIALPGTILYLEADAAIARGANVEFVPTGTRVKTNGGVNPKSGVCLDKPTAAGQLCRVQIKQSV